MKPLPRLLLGSATLALCACGSSAPPPEPRDEDRAMERAIHAPLDKARALDEELQKARREQDAKIEEQGG
ncbi:MAG: hypothetical protein LKM32_01340 [Chiayiivirga sp.]|jgi:hypothetical protein|uniref:hypothetical protein n=1 Tax=Chiayiivirga sp. TaxID=2041042 RepID=UPI0025B8C902|nr:hypothetical protein [Chiayiivirga sp.]MCI1728080.1 hypothetical protein [Chiayiivirga sp.]